MNIILVNDSDFRNISGIAERDLTIYNLKPIYTLHDIQMASYIIYLGGRCEPCFIKCRYKLDDEKQKAILDLFVNNKNLFNGNGLLYSE